MTVSGDLVFKVQGSQANPYVVSASGSGATLFMRCDCAASRRRLNMCKHVAALLCGEVTNVVAGAALVPTLAARAVESPLLQAALKHNPVPRRPDKEMPSYTELTQVVDRLAGSFADAGLLPKVENIHDGGQALYVFTLLKNGSRSTHPVAALRFQPFSYESDTAAPVGVYYFNQTERSKPWSVKAKGVNSTFASLARSLPVLLDALEISTEEAKV